MKNTALLVMDYQNDILKMVGPGATALLGKTKSLIQAARSSGTPVIYVQVAFRPGYPEVNSRNKGFGGLKSTQRMVLGNPGTEIHADVAPLEREVVITKHRVGAFSETDLQTVLRAQNVEHLLFAGISTSGVILSTLRFAADQDYKVTVISDACADTDEEVHRVLMEKIFPRQAEVMTADVVLSMLNGKT